MPGTLSTTSLDDDSATAGLGDGAGGLPGFRAAELSVAELQPISPMPKTKAAPQNATRLMKRTSERLTNKINARAIVTDRPEKARSSGHGIVGARRSMGLPYAKSGVSYG
jgi:hypothetical protein